MKASDAKRGEVPYMTPLLKCLALAAERGFVETFSATSNGLTTSAGRHYSPEELTIMNYYRFEGMSDPDENAILYLIQANDGAAGTLVDAYGAYSDVNVDRTVQSIRAIQKEEPGQLHYTAD